MEDQKCVIPQTEHPKNKKEQPPWRWRDLNERELQAIQMRSQGRSSEEIGQAIGYKAGYVRKLFMQGGRLCQPYADYALYCRGSIKEVADIVIERAKREAPQAIERMVELSEDRSNGPICFKANEYILDLNGVRPKDEPVSYNPTQINIIIRKAPKEEDESK
jgi:hypothetical protein